MRSSTRYTVMFFGFLLLIYFLLLDTLAKPLFESQASEMYGAEVTVESLQISPFVGKITLHKLQVGDRSNAMRNLAQADRTYIDISILQLANDIIEIEELDVRGLMVFADRKSPARILRPLVDEDSDLATAGLPDFEIPDIDALIARQREKLDADIAALKATFDQGETEWKEKIQSLPSEDDIRDYKRSLSALKNSDGGIQDKLAAVIKAKEISKEIHGELERIKVLRKEFRGDIAHMRESIDQAAELPRKHTQALVTSLGLDSSQTAQLGNQVMRGELDGILQQVLAPIAYSTAGKIDPTETTPIHITHATLKGPLLPSAAGLSVEGELSNFSWPLEIAKQAAVLKLRGTSLEGGSLSVDAQVDHRGAADDLITIVVDQLPLRNMPLTGADEMEITLLQSLVNINGELRVQGEQLQGIVQQHFVQTVMDIVLAEDAGDAAQLLAAILQSSNDFTMEMGFSGTVDSPRISFAADLDEIMHKAILGALEQRVGDLTNDLQNRISREVGPQIAAAREQISTLEGLEESLQKNLNNLNQLSN